MKKILKKYVKNMDKKTGCFYTKSGWKATIFIDRLEGIGGRRIEEEESLETGKLPDSG